MRKRTQRTEKRPGMTRRIRRMLKMRGTAKLIRKTASKAARRSTRRMGMRTAARTQMVQKSLHRTVMKRKTRLYFRK